MLMFAESLFYVSGLDPPFSLSSTLSLQVFLHFSATCLPIGRRSPGEATGLKYSADREGLCALCYKDDKVDTECSPELKMHYVISRSPSYIEGVLCRFGRGNLNLFEPEK